MAAAVAPYLLLLLFSIPSSLAINGFSLELIPADSPLSPYYEPAVALSDRWAATVNASLVRLRHLKHLTGAAEPSSSPESLPVPLYSLYHSYLIKIGIGTPPVTVYLALDTATELIWTQCQPCAHCYPHADDAIFDPSKSSSFRKASCGSEYCLPIKNRGCHLRVCTYSIKYLGGMSSSGELGYEAFTLLCHRPSDPVTLFDVVFGCGSDNASPYAAPTQAGVAGFNMAPTSFMAQLGARLQFKFSYCFIDYDNADAASKLMLGEGAVLAGNPTPVGDPDSELYYLTLHDISVGGVRLGIPPGTFRRRDNGGGGLILDSGARLTHLERAAYDMVVKHTKEKVKLPQRQREGHKESLCFTGSKADLENGNVPAMTFHFEGLDVPVRPMNSFLYMPGRMLCLAMAPSSGLSVIGSVFQQNMHVGFNTWRKLVYMWPADCFTFAMPPQC